MTTCIRLGCVKPADIKDADLVLCAGHFKEHAGWVA